MPPSLPSRTPSQSELMSSMEEAGYVFYLSPHETKCSGKAFRRMELKLVSL